MSDLPDVESTLLSLIAGLIEAENGTIFLDGEPSEKSFRKSAKIGYMLQHDHLFEWRSILKNVLLGAEINKSVSQETKQRAKELLRQYGLKRFINSRPSELSGGMRQRAALIRTLMPNPELLLLDEPFPLSIIKHVLPSAMISEKSSNIQEKPRFL